MVYVIVWIIFGFVAAYIGGRRGVNKILSFILGFLFGPFSLLMLFMPVTEGMKKCPNCAELIKEEAKTCKHCGYKFE